MEAYFKDYDVKIGDILIPRKEAEALGLTEACVGKEATVKSGENELANGPVTRVLRDILFAGCGIVKNPANPASVFLDTAALKDNDDEAIVLKNINEVVEEAEVEVDVDDETKDKKEDAGDWIAQPAPDNSLTGPGGVKQDTVGQCIFFRRFAADAGEGASDDWCGLYGQVCTSQYREQKDPDCLYHKAFLAKLHPLVEVVLAEHVATKKEQAREELLEALKEALKAAIEKCEHHLPSMSKKKKKSKKMKKSKKQKKC